MINLKILLFAITLLGLPLEKPAVEWVPCSCNEPAVMGLSEQEFIVFQMYVQGLEHEYRICKLEAAR